MFIVQAAVDIVAGGMHTAVLTKDGEVRVDFNLSFPSLSKHCTVLILFVK